MQQLGGQQQRGQLFGVLVVVRVVAAVRVLKWSRSDQLPFAVGSGLKHPHVACHLSSVQVNTSRRMLHGATTHAVE